MVFHYLPTYSQKGHGPFPKESNSDQMLKKQPSRRGKVYIKTQVSLKVTQIRKHSALAQQWTPLLAMVQL